MPRTAVPQSHRDFLTRRPIYFAHGEAMFVHAGVRPGIAIQHQAEDDLVWIRDGFLDDRGEFPWLLVHQRPEFRRRQQPGRTALKVAARAQFGRSRATIKRAIRALCSAFARILGGASSSRACAFSSRSPRSRPLPGVEALTQIALGLRVSLDWLVLGDEDAALGGAFLVRLAAERAALPTLKNLIEAQQRNESIPMPEFLAHEIGAHAAQLAEMLVTSGLTMAQMTPFIKRSESSSTRAMKDKIADLRRQLDEIKAGDLKA